MTDSAKQKSSAETGAACLTACVQAAAENDETIVHGTFTENGTGEDFSGASFRACRFLRCSLTGCDFTGCDFTETVFEGCNFSGSTFRDCTFLDCTVQNAKWTGADFSGAYFKNCTVKGCMLNLAAFDSCRVQSTELTGCDCTGASLCAVSWKQVHAADCKLVENNFFKTSLSGADLSHCRFEAPVVSSDLTELHGAKMTPLQFDGLAGLLKIKLV